MGAMRYFQVCRLDSSSSMRELLSRSRHSSSWMRASRAASPARLVSSAGPGGAGAPVVELHTGQYAEARGADAARELERLRDAARHAAQLGLEVHAGHGLHYQNVQPVAAIPQIVELNIGHAIVARAVFTGLEPAVREMKALMLAARR